MKESGKHLNQPCNRALLLYTELTLTLLMLQPFLKNKAQNEMLLPCIIKFFVSYVSKLTTCTFLMSPALVHFRQQRYTH
jgi:hypothetical protein